MENQLAVNSDEMTINKSDLSRIDLSSLSVRI